MSCFKLSKGIYTDITKLTANFWWSKPGKEKAMHWLPWEQLTEAKEAGGLGFKEIEAFNTALLGKQIWRIITKPNLLMARVLKCKYFPKTDIFQAVSKPRDSWLWKSWNAAKCLIQEGSGWQIGNGSSIKVWEDPWLHDCQWRKPISPRPRDCQVQKVKDLFNQNGEGWNAPLIRSLFNEIEAQSILRLPVSSMGAGDRLVWKATPNGLYSVSSGYQLAKEKIRQAKDNPESSRKHDVETKQSWQKVWGMAIKKKLQHFLWKARHNRIPVGTQLKLRGLIEDDTCTICGDAAETLEHMFFQCRKSKLIWKLSPVGWDNICSDSITFSQWWCEFSNANKDRNFRRAKN